MKKKNSRIEEQTFSSHRTFSFEQMCCKRFSIVVLFKGLKRNLAQRLVIGSIILKERQRHRTLKTRRERKLKLTG